jgi:ribonuclease PH
MIQGGNHQFSFQPTDESIGVLECEVKFSSSQIDESSSATTAGVGSNDNNAVLNYERQLSTHIKDAITASILLEKYPKSTIYVSVLILSKKNVADLAVSITASSLALANASIQLKDIVTAVHLPVTATIPCSLTLAEMGRLETLTTVLLEGALDESSIQSCIQAGRVECAKLRTTIDEYKRTA